MFEAEQIKIVSLESELMETRQQLAQAQRSAAQLIPIILAFLGLAGRAVEIPKVFLRQIPLGLLLKAEDSMDGAALRVSAVRLVSSGVVGPDGKPAETKEEPWPPEPKPTPVPE